MHDLPATWTALCELVFLLARHGFDADHLAAIDGMTRHPGEPRSLRLTFRMSL